MHIIGSNALYFILILLNIHVGIRLFMLMAGIFILGLLLYSTVYGIKYESIVAKSSTSSCLFNKV